jgi:hypothetical protein
MSTVPRRIRDSWILASMRPPIPPKFQLQRAGDAKVDLVGKRVLLTGASSGIGEAAAEKFARRGAVVAVVARREDRLNDLVGRIEASGGSAHALPRTCRTSRPSTSLPPPSRPSSAALTSSSTMRRARYDDRWPNRLTVGTTSSGSCN